MFGITIKGIEYVGFVSGQVDLSIDSLANTFSASLTDHYKSKISDIKAQDLATITLDGVQIIRGYIDSVIPTLNNDSVSISINGRSRSQDIVDCSIDTQTGEWKGLKFETLMNQLCNSFGLVAIAKVDTGAPIETVNYDQGQTIHELLIAHANNKQLLVYSDKDGNLLIDNAGTTTADLELKEGENGNVLTASSNVNFTERFNEYIVRGDSQTNSFIAEADATQIESRIKDEGVKRKRPIIIVADGEATQPLLDKRAKWEKSVRAGKSITYTARVNGWHNVINQLVSCNMPTISCVGKFLANNVSMSFDATGKFTTISLISASAYEKLEVDLTDSDKTNSFTQPES